MSCDCKSGSNVDQTPKEVGEWLEAEYRAGRRVREPLGMGSFLIPDPAAGALLTQVVLVHELTHREAILRGLNCRAFKWFPYGMTLEIDGKQETIEPTYALSKKPCSGGSPCGWGAYCGDPRECFCDGDFFGIKYCSF